MGDDAVDLAPSVGRWEGGVEALVGDEIVRVGDQQPEAFGCQRLGDIVEDR